MIREPFGSSFIFLATAASVAPEEIPTKIPSSLATFCAYSKDSSFDTCMVPSRTSVCRLTGIKPAPIPWSGCGPGCPPLITGDCSGSTAKAFRLGKTFFNSSATPVICPPVPTPVIR